MKKANKLTKRVVVQSIEKKAQCPDAGTTFAYPCRYYKL